MFFPAYLASRYEFRPYFKKFIYRLMQIREELKKKGTQCGAFAIKVTNYSPFAKELKDPVLYFQTGLCAFFGFSLMEATNFERSSVLTEASLTRKRPVRNSLKRCVLLGAIDPDSEDLAPRGEGHEDDELGLCPDDYLEQGEIDEEEEAVMREERRAIARGFIEDEAADAGDVPAANSDPAGSQNSGRKPRKKATARCPKNLPPLYYLAGFHRKSARIRNLIPLGAAILQQSKFIFLNKVRILLTCLDPRSAELAYMDTGKYCSV